MKILIELNLLNPNEAVFSNEDITFEVESFLELGQTIVLKKTNFHGGRKPWAELKILQILP